MNRVRVNEGSTGQLTGTLVDATGTAVPITDVSMVLLSMIDLDSADLTVSPVQGILNDRLQADVTADIAIDADGRFTWVLQPEDNIIVNPRRQVERHRAIFTFFYGAVGSPAVSALARVECEIEVQNLNMVS
jgi:hypothetical protein